MIKDRFGALTNRRSLFRRGAMASGAAAAAGIGLSRHRAFAADSINDSLLKRVLDRGKLIVGTGATNPPWHFEGENGEPVGGVIVSTWLVMSAAPNGSVTSARM